MIEIWLQTIALIALAYAFTTLMFHIKRPEKQFTLGLKWGLNRGPAGHPARVGSPSQSKTLSVIKDRERNKTGLSVVGELLMAASPTHQSTKPGRNSFVPGRGAGPDATARIEKVPWRTHQTSRPGRTRRPLRNLPPSLPGLGAPVPSGRPTGPAPGAFPYSTVLPAPALAAGLRRSKGGRLLQRGKAKFVAVPVDAVCSHHWLPAHLRSLFPVGRASRVR